MASIGVCLKQHRLRSMPPIAKPLHRVPTYSQARAKVENGNLTLEWAEADNPPHISPRANHVGRAVG